MACVTTATFASRLLYRAQSCALRRVSHQSVVSHASLIVHRRVPHATSIVSRVASSPRGRASTSAAFRFSTTRLPWRAGKHTNTKRARSTLIPHAVEQSGATETSSICTEAESRPDTMDTTLLHSLDRYGGVIVDPLCLEKFDTAAEVLFVEKLTHSLTTWKANGIRGVWLEIPTGSAHLIGPAVQQCGFTFHHAEKTHVMVTHWLSENELNGLPPNASHQVGIGAFVVNGDGKVLLVQEKRGPAASASRPDFWKLPTGLVEQGEDVPDAAVREVFEETGVKCEFHSILGIRHGHNAPFGKSDMFFLVSLRIADGKTHHAIAVQESEIAKAEWRDRNDAFESQHIAKGSHMDHLYGLCRMHLGGTYRGMGLQNLPAGFGRDGTVVTYSNADAEGVMASNL